MGRTDSEGKLMIIYTIVCSDGCGTKLGTLAYADAKVPIDIERRLRGYYVPGHEPQKVVIKDPVETFKETLIPGRPVTSEQLQELLKILRP